MLFRVQRRIGQLVWAPAGWLTLKEECLEGEAEGPCESAPVVPRLEEDAEGRVDFGVRPSRLEEEAEGTCEVGTVELRLVEDLVEA